MASPTPIERWLYPSAAGLYCAPGDFYIDPTRPVPRALITHGHSDHARPGHGAVLATQETLDMMRLRYGDGFAGSTQEIRYGESVVLDGVKVSFYPAGHVLGSAQIAVEADGCRIVASGAAAIGPTQTCSTAGRFALYRRSGRLRRGNARTGCLGTPKLACQAVSDISFDHLS